MRRTCSLTFLVLPAIAVAAACTVGQPPTGAAPPADEPVLASATTSPPGAEPAEPSGDGYPPPCASADLRGAIAPGESGDPTTWTSVIVVTSVRSDACVLDGVSQVEFRTGGSGAPLGVQQVTDAAAESSPVVLAAGEQAAMSLAYPTSFDDPAPGDCVTDGQFVDVVLPANQEVVEAWFPDRRLGLPPVCGAVATGAWQEGGAPGVPAS